MATFHTCLTRLFISTTKELHALLALIIEATTVSKLSKIKSFNYKLIMLSSAETTYYFLFQKKV